MAELAVPRRWSLSTTGGGRRSSGSRKARTRSSGPGSRAWRSARNAVRLQLHALAYNLANFLRTLALPREVAEWSLTSLREKVVKIGAKVVAHGRYLVFQMAEVAVPREVFRGILNLIAGLRPPVVVRC